MLFVTTDTQQHNPVGKVRTVTGISGSYDSWLFLSLTHHLEKENKIPTIVHLCVQTCFLMLFRHFDSAVYRGRLTFGGSCVTSNLWLNPEHTSSGYRADSLERLQNKKERSKAP